MIRHTINVNLVNSSLMSKTVSIVQILIQSIKYLVYSVRQRVRDESI